MNNFTLAPGPRELTDAVVQNAQLQEAQKHETLEVIEAIAKQAEAKPESRSLGTLKVMIAGSNSLISTSQQLLAVWDKCSPLLKHFFKL